VPSRRAPALESPRALFLVIVALEVGHTAFAIWQHRIPTGHDGFQFFTLQYYFLNNAIQGGGVSQWIPFMTQGTVGSLWYAIQGSLLQNVLLYVPSLVRRIDLVTIYHLNMLVDELVLLTGTWLLARRFFRTPAAFFVSVSVLGSCVWLDQPYWNFRFYYPLPLVFELGERFFETTRWRWFALSANLLAFHSIRSLPYFAPATSFAVFGYFASRFAVDPAEFWSRIRALRWGWPAAGAFACAAVSFAVAYGCLTMGSGPLVAFNNLRRPDGTVDLDVFLTYGGLTDLRKWIELVLGISPWLDATLYAGIFLLPLLLVGVVALDRRRLHFVVFGAVLLLFTMGTFVSTAAFYVWPGMRYFRHIGLVSPFVKVMGCFVAGIGFERLFDERRVGRTRATAVAAVASATLLVAAGIAALYLSASDTRVTRYVQSLSVAGEDMPRHATTRNVLRRRMTAAGRRSIAAGLLIGIVPLAMASAAAPRRRQALVLLMLAAGAADLYWFKFAYLVDRSDAIKPEWRYVTHPAAMPYPRRRSADLREVMGENPRMRATFAFNELLLMKFTDRPTLGAHYWTNNAFWFADEAGSTLQVDSWQKSYDQLIRAFEGFPVDDSSIAPIDYDGYHLPFPLRQRSAGHVLGITADKIRFFSRAHTLPRDQDFEHLFRNPEFGGDQLFIPASSDPPPFPSLGAWTPDLPLGADETTSLAYDVTRFDSNNLDVHVTNPGGEARWLSYADAWHPLWHATVNGRAVPVLRAQLGYKAVPLDAGENIVRFHFGSRLFTWLTLVVAATCAGWLVIVGWLMIGVARPIVRLPERSG